MKRDAFYDCNTSGNRKKRHGIPQIAPGAVPKIRKRQIREIKQKVGAPL